MNSVQMQTSAYHEGQVESVEASLLQLQPSLPLTPTSLQQSCWDGDEGQDFSLIQVWENRLLSI
jgi:hypothetical protein